MNEVNEHILIQEAMKDLITSVFSFAQLESYYNRDQFIDSDIYDRNHRSVAEWK